MLAAASAVVRSHCQPRRFTTAGYKLTRKVLWTARLSLASMQGCEPAKMQNLTAALAVASFALRGLRLETMRLHALKSDLLKLVRALDVLLALADASGCSLRVLTFNIESVCSIAAETTRALPLCAVERKL